MFSAAKSGTTIAGAYTLSNSLRFRASASAYLNRTFTTPTNNKIFTWSAWVKLGTIPSSREGIFVASNSGATVYFILEFNASAGLSIFDSNTSAPAPILVTTQVFRDPSAWYHIVIAVDTTQATAANRIKIYINGSQITSFSSATYPAQNSNPYMNSAVAHAISSYQPYSAFYFDGYMTEVNFIDGQALTPSSFGSTNATTGVWQPAKYTGTYGTNGFYLNFNSIALTSGSNAGLGKDNSGNGNYWNTNNISVTAGTTYDAMTDVPTLTSATVANYCVINPIDPTAASISNANLSMTSTGAVYRATRATFGMSSGKWYWEQVFSGASQNGLCGVGLNTASLANYVGGDANGWGYYAANGNKYNNATGAAYGATYVAGDIIGIAFDADAGTLIFYKNNTSQGTAYTLTTGLTYYPMLSQYNSDIWNVNFGQRPFSYTPPSGYKALNTYNLPDSTVVKGNKVMDATLYTGNLTGQSITNAATFKPDLVWIKSRSAATDNKLTDSVRGATIALISNSTGAETTDVTGLTAFNTNGFTVGASTVYNNTAATYVGWQWQAGQGSSSSGTGTGGMSSVVQSVNTSAGFSVVTFTGNATNGTFTHGLGVAPKMFIIKNRTSAGSWGVWHNSLSTPTTALLLLDSTGAQSNAATYWNSTVPTSSVVSMGTAWASGNYVAYCWAEIAGFNKFGSYVGNGSTDGPFVYTGFRPKWIMIKNSNIGSDWIILDTSRDSYNMEINYLIPDTAGAEASGASVQLDGLSNGFKIRGSWVGINTSGNTIIYAAFAENPFKNALAR